MCASEHSFTNECFGSDVCDVSANTFMRDASLLTLQFTHMQ